jgi:tetratricopeptide (TPR) repeat protein
MIIPGSQSPETQSAAKCAIDAFERLRKLKPSDPRGEPLYVQTLFDAGAYDKLAKMFEKQFEQNPKNLDAVHGLIQVYTQWDKLDEALLWYEKKAEIKANDPEALYTVGVFLWQKLFQKGGGPDKTSWLPYDLANPSVKPVPPLFAYGDIVSQQRIDLADKGIKYLEQAIALRPEYMAAMAYVNLLWRQKAIAYVEYPEDWQKCIDEAEKWRTQAVALTQKAKAAEPGSKDAPVPVPVKGSDI